MRSLAHLGAAGLALCVGVGVLSGCTSDEQPSGFVDKAVPIGSYRLVAFDSCDDALNGLRAAAKSAVGPYGFGGGVMFDMGGTAKREAGAPQAADAAAGAPPGARTGAGAGQDNPTYSGTNTHEVGVDEPDLVKTDGRRIVTVTGSVLRIVDAASRTVTGTLDLADSTDEQNKFRYVPNEMLLSGNHALLLVPQNGPLYGGDLMMDRAAPPPPGGASPNIIDTEIYGPKLVLVDLAGEPRVLSSMSVDGSLVDARQVGSTARVVIRSNPRISFPNIRENVTDTQRTQANRGIIDQTPIERWLPRIETRTGGTTQQSHIGCDAVSRPAVYTGSNLLTVLSLDLSAPSLGDGRPTTLVADGDTVYSNGPSLYVSSNQSWRAIPEPAVRTDQAKPAETGTEIYKFDTSTPDRPTFTAGGRVPGYLINQYAMSEWDGKLRVATTSGAQGQQTPSQSGVYILAQNGKTLAQIGSVEGLGKGERIYAVRFAGPVGYVVTFRQTDPLYTVDLSDPQKPAVRGELKIPGYSAYLHPIDGNMLIGVGQDATDQGRVTGTQVSLFNVANLSQTARVAQYKLSNAHSEAEFDPHAFLYWPADKLLVVPLQSPNATPADSGNGATTKVMPSVGALVLRVNGNSLSEVAFVKHPTPGVLIRRSLVIDRTLWTVSDSGLLASDLSNLNRTTWLAFS